MLGNRMMPCPLGVPGKPHWIWLACLLGLVACSPAPRIGFLGTLSGPGSELGSSGRDGVQLATESARARLEICDDRANEESAAACMARFDSLGIRVVVGPMTSNVAERVAEEAAKRRIVVVSPTVSSAALSGKDDFFVKLMPNNVEDMDILAEHLVRRRHSSVSILYGEGNAAYAEPVARRLGEILVGKGVDVRLLEGYTGGTSLAFDPWIRRMEDSSAVVVLGPSMDVGVFLKDRDRMGKVLQVHTSHWGMGSDLLRVGGSSAEGVILTGMPEQVSDASGVERLRAQYGERFARPPGYGAVFGWEAAQIALKIAGTPGSHEALRAVLRDTALAPLGWRLGLDSLGDTKRRSILCQVRDGRYEALP